MQRALKHPIYSVINITGLALGMACFILVMLWVKHETSYDRFYKNANRIYKVAFTNNTNEYYGYYQTGALAGYLKQNFPDIAEATCFNPTQFKISYNLQGYNCTGSYVDTGFVRMFTLPFVNGDTKTALHRPNSVVITETLSNKLFGDEDPIGQPVKINENSQYTVSGVIKDVPKNSSIQYDLLMPFSNTQEWMRTWDARWTMTYVMLQDGISAEDVNQKISGVMNRFQPTWKNVLFLFPLTDSHLHNLKGGGLIVYVWGFSLMAVIILVLACVNFMNLSTSRFELRFKEVFIKKIAGSKRSEVSAQFLFEAGLLSVFSLMIATVVALVLLPFVRNLLQTQLQFNFNAQTIIILLGIALFTGILAGSYPALYLSNLTPGKILKGSIQKGKSKKWNFRRILVIFQFAISVFFISCTLMVSKQLNYLQSKNLGIQKENIISLSTNGALGAKAQELKNEILTNPNIESVTLSNDDMTSWNNSGPISWDGSDQLEPIEIGYKWVDEDFLKTFDLKMKEGRFFSKDYTSDESNSFILNQKAVSYLGLKKSNRHES